MNLMKQTLTCAPMVTEIAKFAIRLGKQGETHERLAHHRFPFARLQQKAGVVVRKSARCASSYPQAMACCCRNLLEKHMTDWGWAVVENIALLAAMCFLVWFTDSVWWVLLLMFANVPGKKK